MPFRLPFLLLAAAIGAGCTGGPQPGVRDDGPVPRAAHEAARADVAQLRLELARARQQAERLRVDLDHAERTLVALESGLRGVHSRADAVSSLADARIVVERIERQEPWNRAATGRARDKLAEAERHIEAGRFASALFFTARARGIAEEALARTAALRADPATRYVRVDDAKVRAGPSPDAEVALVLSQGTPIRPGDHDGDWVQIVTPGNEGGWIRDSLLTEQP